MRWLHLLAIPLVIMSCSKTTPTEGHEGHERHEAAGSGGHHGKHGNPEDLAAYAAKMVDPERDEWQQPDRVVEALGLTEGQIACDIGVGPGYFALRMATRLGSEGAVYGVDVEPTMLVELGRAIEASGVTNVVPVYALPADPLLPAGLCDLILVVDTYHHFPDGPRYLARLARSLAPGGRLVNIDFHKRENPVGPAPDHLISKEDFLSDARSAGLELAREHDFLAHQYFLELQLP